MQFRDNDAIRNVIPVTHLHKNLKLINIRFWDIFFSFDESPPKAAEGVKNKLLKGDEHPQGLMNTPQKLCGGWESAGAKPKIGL